MFPVKYSLIFVTKSAIHNFSDKITRFWSLEIWIFTIHVNFISLLLTTNASKHSVAFTHLAIWSKFQNFLFIAPTIHYMTTQCCHNTADGMKQEHFLFLQKFHFIIIAVKCLTLWLISALCRMVMVTVRGTVLYWNYPRVTLRSTTQGTRISCQPLMGHKSSILASDWLAGGRWQSRQKQRHSTHSDFLPLSSSLELTALHTTK